MFALRRACSAIKSIINGLSSLEHPRRAQHSEEIYIKINQLNSQFFARHQHHRHHRWHYKFMPVMIRVMKIFQNVNKNYIIYGKNPRLRLSSCNDTKKMWNFLLLLIAIVFWALSHSPHDFILILFYDCCWCSHHHDATRYYYALTKLKIYDGWYHFWCYFQTHIIMRAWIFFSSHALVSISISFRLIGLSPTTNLPKWAYRAKLFAQRGERERKRKEMKMDGR